MMETETPESPSGRSDSTGSVEPFSETFWAGGLVLDGSHGALDLVPDTLRRIQSRPLLRHANGDSEKSPGVFMAHAQASRVPFQNSAPPSREGTVTPCAAVALTREEAVASAAAESGNIAAVLPDEAVEALLTATTRDAPRCEAALRSAWSVGMQQCRDFWKSPCAALRIAEAALANLHALSARTARGSVAERSRAGEESSIRASVFLRVLADALNQMLVTNASSEVTADNLPPALLPTLRDVACAAARTAPTLLLDVAAVRLAAATSRAFAGSPHAREVILLVLERVEDASTAAVRESVVWAGENVPHLVTADTRVAERWVASLVHLLEVSGTAVQSSPAGGSTSDGVGGTAAIAMSQCAAEGHGLVPTRYAHADDVVSMACDLLRDLLSVERVGSEVVSVVGKACRDALLADTVSDLLMSGVCGAVTAARIGKLVAAILAIDAVADPVLLLRALATSVARYGVACDTVVVEASLTVTAAETAAMDGEGRSRVAAAVVTCGLLTALLDVSRAQYLGSSHVLDVVVASLHQVLSSATGTTMRALLEAPKQLGSTGAGSAATSILDLLSAVTQLGETAAIKTHVRSLHLLSSNRSAAHALLECGGFGALLRCLVCLDDVEVTAILVGALLSLAVAVDKRPVPRAVLLRDEEDEECFLHAMQLALCRECDAAVEQRWAIAHDALSLLKTFNNPQLLSPTAAAAPTSSSSTLECASILHILCELSDALVGVMDRAPSPAIAADALIVFAMLLQRALMAADLFPACLPDDRASRSAMFDPLRSAVEEHRVPLAIFQCAVNRSPSGAPAEAACPVTCAAGYALTLLVVVDPDSVSELLPLGGASLIERAANSISSRTLTRKQRALCAEVARQCLLGENCGVTLEVSGDTISSGLSFVDECAERERRLLCEWAADSRFEVFHGRELAERAAASAHLAQGMFFAMHSACAGCCLHAHETLLQSFVLQLKGPRPRMRFGPIYSPSAIAESTVEVEVMVRQEVEERELEARMHLVRQAMSDTAVLQLRRSLFDVLPRDGPHHQHPSAPVAPRLQQREVPRPHRAAHVDCTSHTLALHPTRRHYEQNGNAGDVRATRDEAAYLRQRNERLANELRRSAVVNGRLVQQARVAEESVRLLTAHLERLGVSVEEVPGIGRSTACLRSGSARSGEAGGRREPTRPAAAHPHYIRWS